MPQIRLEYTANTSIHFNFRGFFSEVHKTINQTAGISILNCKSRAIKHENYFIGNCSDNNAFVHMEIALLKGRSEDVKKKIARACLEILKKHFLSNSSKDELQLTVEIKDIDREFYLKYPEGTLSKL